MDVFIHEVSAAWWETLTLSDPPSASERAAIRIAGNKLLKTTPSEVSFYRSTSPADSQLIAAALASRHSSRETFKYIEVLEGDFNAIGATFGQTMGNSPIHQVNDWHYDVDLDSGRAQGLVFQLLSRGTIPVWRFSQLELRRRAQALGPHEHELEPDHWLFDPV